MWLDWAPGTRKRVVGLGTRSISLTCWVHLQETADQNVPEELMKIALQVR